MRKKLVGVGIVLMILLASFGLNACGDTDADVASENLSKAAEQFEIERRVVFFNGITDKYLLSIEGLCSIEDEGRQLEVTCKLPDGKFKKNYLGLSDNVSYFIEQIGTAAVSTSQYRSLAGRSCRRRTP